MICPHCGGTVVYSQATWQRAMLEAGRCASCGQVRDYPGSATYCRACSTRRSEQMRRRYWGGDKANEPVRDVRRKARA